MADQPPHAHDAVTTPVGFSTMCPQCGVMLDALTTSCGACGAVITGPGAAGDRADKVRRRLQEAIGDAFTLGGLLGRGGMGIVFRAREAALDRDVALKVLAFDAVLNPDAYERFEREARLAARLDHPNIVPIFAVGQRNGAAFYTMRLVKGGSLEERLAAGPVSLDDARSVLRDVAAALDYAHANGVVHRDVKPANVLIGDAGHALVADFGIARAFDAGSGGATSTGTGVVGSPAYMSPEQWRGEKVDGRADQYALAIVAFELLTGRRPFGGTSMQELLRMHLTEEAPHISSLRRDLPGATGGALARALSKDPAERFSSTTEFVNALSLGHSSSAPTHRVPAAPPRPAERPPAAATPIARTATNAPSPGVAAPAHRSLWPAAVLLLAVGGLIGVVLSQRAAMRRDEKARAAATTPLPAAAVNAESLRVAEQAQETENAELRKEVADTRRIALEAEARMEAMSRAKAPKAAAAAPAPVAHAHVFVMTRGGTPSVLVDGVEAAAASPAVVEMPPGHHRVSVRGAGSDFFPVEYGVDLAPNDTQQVIFLSRRVAAQQALRRNAPKGALPPRAPRP